MYSMFVCVCVFVSSGGVLSFATSSFLSVHTMADSVPRGLTCVYDCVHPYLCVFVPVLCVCLCVSLETSHSSTAVPPQH